MDIQYVYYAFISSLSVLKSFCHNNFCGVWVDETTFPYYSQRRRRWRSGSSSIASAAADNDVAMTNDDSAAASFLN